MKKVKLYILQTIWFLSALVEFMWSVVCAIMGAIGEKMNEITDVLEISIEKQKAKS
jgi:hypothetical protein